MHTKLTEILHSPVFRELMIRKMLLGIGNLTCSLVKAKVTVHTLSNRSGEDRTQTGHILGDAQHRRGQGVSDRSMSPVVFVLIRLLTHLTMLLGATKDPQVSPSRNFMWAREMQ